ncbi:hypothetical protein AB1L30_16460 [Bremerella sp. JC817]|uniref:hypothetical protein n=1 Tax=Bremerella sp. JC817 TaxID=3231756 RepID=UPI00345764ED
MTKPHDNEARQKPEPREISSGQAAYNIVSDTYTGVNVRWRDNLLQAAFTLGMALLAAAVVAILAVLNPSWKLPWYGGALIGAFVGLVLGVFTSGIFLMFYRGIRHLRGRHD